MHALDLEYTPRPLSLAEHLADLAVEALIDEADLSPKPALVDRRGSGAHQDLHLGLMHASALSLWPMFKDMAQAAGTLANIGLPLREALGRIGREGEQRMLEVTAGTNTHRGAIWALGLLSAAAALHPDDWRAERLTLSAARLALLDDRFATQRASNGSEAARRFRVPGAREQAQLGFPAVLQHGLPQLRASRAAGHGEQSARLDALLAIMGTLDDTCILHRGGLPALHTMHAGARAVLEAGGSATLAGRRRLLELDRQLLALNASPGGAADLLAACLFIDRLEQGEHLALGEH